MRSGSLRARKQSKKKLPTNKEEEPPASVKLGGVEPQTKPGVPTLADYIQNNAADELFSHLREYYDAEQLTKLADLIHEYLTPDQPPVAA
jgi:hypothetical protein